ncbi:unnamed protein product [Gadus morhua 'NCC']
MCCLTNRWCGARWPRTAPRRDIPAFGERDLWEGGGVPRISSTTGGNGIRVQLLSQLYEFRGAENQVKKSIGPPLVTLDVHAPANVHSAAHVHAAAGVHSPVDEHSPVDVHSTVDFHSHVDVHTPAGVHSAVVASLEMMGMRSPNAFPPPPVCEARGGEGGRCPRLIRQHYTIQPHHRIIRPPGAGAPEGRRYGTDRHATPLLNRVTAPI